MDHERLLTHRGFVRTLARRLVLDESRVDDVEQQTWMAALRGGPRDPGKLRGWLGAVTRNFARRQLRDEALRRAREASTDHGAPTPPAEEFLEHEARRREVVDAVMKLAEPYRTVVLLRWFKELPPKAIAKQLGVPVETVKTRLKRGLERLRVDLDARHGGDRAAWCAWLVPFAVPETASAGAVGVTLTGAWMMKSSVAWVAGVLVVAAVAAMLARSGPDDGSRPPEGPVTPESATVEVAAAPSERATAALSRAERRESVDPSESFPAATEDGPTPDESEATVALDGLVLDPTGAPFPGAIVRLQVRAWSEFTLLDRDVEDEGRVLFERETDGDGRFRFMLVPGRAVDVLVMAEGHPVEFLESRFGGEALTVRLRRGARFFGTITRARDGLPVEGVVVRGFESGGSADRFRGVTDATGRFDFEGVPPGDMYVEITPEHEKGPPWLRVHLDDGEQRQHDVVLDEGILVHGRVTDAASGAPIAGAILSHGWTFKRTVTSGPDGRYELPGFGASGVYDIHVRAAGYGKQETPDLDLAPATVEHELDFALRPARRVTGRVVDPSGSPIEDAYVAAVANQWDEDREGGAVWSQGTQVTDWVSSRSGADGRFSIGDLRPDARHALLVRADAYAVAIVDFPAGELEQPEIPLGDVVLAAPITVKGLVVDQHGRVVPRAEVTLTGHPEGRFTRSGRDEPWFTGYVDERESRADDQGRFVFRDVGPGTYQLHPNRGRDETGPPVELVLRSGDVNREARLTVERGLEVSGKVVGPHGEGVSRAIVYVAGVEGGNLGVRMVGGDGTFTVKGLPPGEVRLTAEPLSTGDEAVVGPRIRGSASRDVAAGTRGVVLELRLALVISGRVADSAGTGVERAIVTARDASGSKADVTFTSEEGGFELDVPPTGRFRIEVQRTTESATPGKAFDLQDAIAAVVSDVAAGTTDLLIEVE